MNTQGLSQRAALTLTGQTIATAAPVTSQATGGLGSEVTLKAKVDSSASLAVNDSVIRKGEQIWLAGKVKQGSRVSPKHTVAIEGRKSSASKWQRLTTVRTSSTGKFTATVLPSRSYEYRARVAATSGASGAASKSKRVKLSSAKRNLASRTNVIGSRLGKPSSGIRSLSTSQRKGVRVKELRSVQYRAFTKATLVKVVYP